MIEPRICTRREAADYLRCTERTIDRLRRSGQLKSFRIGASIRFWLADIEALLSVAA